MGELSSASSTAFKWISVREWIVIRSDSKSATGNGQLSDYGIWIGDVAPMPTSRQYRPPISMLDQIGLSYDRLSFIVSVRSVFRY